jgi:hypothetical protein
VKTIEEVHAATHKMLALMTKADVVYIHAMFLANDVDPERYRATAKMLALMTKADGVYIHAMFLADDVDPERYRQIQGDAARVRKAAYDTARAEYAKAMEE